MTVKKKAKKPKVSKWYPCAKCGKKRTSKSKGAECLKCSLGDQHTSNIKGYPCKRCGKKNQFKVKDPGVNCLSCILEEAFHGG